MKATYACPMHPDVVSDRPGECPKCHMALEKIHDSAAKNDKHSGHHAAVFRQKFWVSLALTLPTLLFSHTLQGWLGWELRFVGSQYIPAIFGTFLFFYGGWIFLRSARAELASRKPGMMTLIAMAIVVAFVYSLLVTAGLVGGMDFWWELASLITIMLLGHWLEMASVMSASDAVGQLAKLIPPTAEVELDGSIREIALADVKIGAVVLVRPGASVPVDGEVIDGTSSVDESMLTGESQPVAKQIGALVVAGAINGSGSLRVKVTKIGDDTAISKIIKLVRQAERHKSQTQVLADKAAGYLFYAALAVALFTAVGWGFAGANLSDILQRVVTVLIIACPHALGLAVPLVVSISTGLAARRGIVIRDRRDFEAARNVSVVLFDKTGTLTTGKQTVVSVSGDVLALAAAIEQDSEHPIAAAIRRFAEEKDVEKKVAADFRALPGLGVCGVIDDEKVMLGGDNLLRDQGIDPPKNDTTNAMIYVIRRGKIIGALEIGDAVRETSKLAVANLQRQNIKVVMVTGDSGVVAKRVAKELNIADVHAGVLPADKASIIANYQAKGEKVAFVGDGVNDAPALARADVGVAIGAGTDVAIDSAGVLLAGNDPYAVSDIITLSRVTYRKMIENLVWGAGYNIIALPLAAGLLAPIGVVLSPAIGAVLMSCSTIIVALNAQGLRRTFSIKERKAYETTAVPSA